MTFKALLATRPADLISTALVDFDEADLMAGDVTVAIDYSTVNYKDALAISGRAPVLRQFPLIPGIDFADLERAKLARATQLVALADVPGLAEPILQGRVRGRAVVDVNA